MLRLRSAWLAAAFVFATAYGIVHAAPASAQQKFAVVDLQRALTEIEEGKKAKTQLKTLFDQRQKTLDKQQEDLRVLKEGIEKQKDVLSREVYGKKVEELQKALAELQATYMEFQRELAAKEADLTRPILERLQRVVKQIGQKEGYVFVFERNEAGVVYTSSYDMTDLVIQRYNAGDGGSAAPAATGPAKPKPAAK